MRRCTLAMALLTWPRHEDKASIPHGAFLDKKPRPIVTPRNTTSHDDTPPCGTAWTDRNSITRSEHGQRETRPEACVVTRVGDTMLGRVGTGRTW